MCLNNSSGKSETVKRLLQRERKIKGPEGGKLIPKHVAPLDVEIKYGELLCIDGSFQLIQDTTDLQKFNKHTRIHKIGIEFRIYKWVCNADVQTQG
jgi:hypothetical protein